MKFLYTLIIGIILITNQSAHSQEPKAINPPQQQPQIPNPLDLKSNWWNYFKGDKSIVTLHIDNFIKNLHLLIEESPEELKEKAKTLISKIETNMHVYLTAISQPLETPPPLPPIKKQYRTEDIVSLDREIKNLQILLDTDKVDYDERKKQIASGKERYAALLKNYKETEPRSENRLISGLQLIDLLISLELAKEKQARLSKTIKTDNQIKDKMLNELDVAKTRLFSDAGELEKAQKNLDNAQESWNLEKKELREEEANTLAAYDFTLRGEEAKLSNQLLSQKLTLAAIEESITYNNYIFKEIQLELIRYLNYPEKIERIDLEKKSKEWDTNLSQLNQNIQEWELSTRRDIQRAEEWISLNIQLDDNNAAQIKELQEEILRTAESSLVMLIKLRNETQSSQFLFDIVKNIVVKGKDGYERAWLYFRDSILNAFKTPGAWITQPLITIGDTTIDASSILQFLIILIITIWIARVLGSTVNRYATKRKDIKLSLLYRINRLFQYFIIVIGIFVALSVIGFDFSNLVLIAGALGVGLGFGLQTLFNNFVSGIVILFENQLKVGDYVELESGVCGEVREINVRSTYIKTNDGIAIMVPNSEFTTARVVNWTHKEPYRRVQIPFSVAYDSDKDFVKKVVREAILKAPITLKKSWAPEPRVYIESFGPSSIEFKVSVWVDDNATKRSSYTRSMYLWMIHDALLTNNIKIPYPQLDLHVESVLDKTTLQELKKTFTES